MDFYTAAQLRAVPGSFTASGFVTSVTGVDNVCERAAVLASGGKLLLPKWARDGVTFAAALRPFARIGDGEMMNRNVVYVVGLGPGDSQFLTAQAAGRAGCGGCPVRIYGLC